MSNFSRKKKYAFYNNNTESIFSNSLNRYINNNIYDFPSYSYQLNYSNYNNHLKIPFNYNFQCPQINYPINKEQKTKNNNDEINCKFEEMSRTIKKLNEEILALKEDNGKNFKKLNEEILALKEDNDKLNEDIKNIKEENSQIKKEILNINENMDKIKVKLRKFN